MSGKTLLMIAYHFPPDNSVGAARPFRFYKYIPMFGWKPVVITAAAPEPGCKRFDVHCVEDSFFGTARSLKWQAERVIRRLATPADMALSWSRQAAKTCERYINAEDRVVLYSSFPPLGVHLAALQVLRKRHLPWIADYRDPFASEPTRNMQLTVFSRFVARQLEKRMIETPSIIVANTEAAAQEWKRDYPHVANRIKVIWNGYDPSDDLTAPPLADSGRKVILHAGTMYGGRHTGPILSSIYRLLHTGCIAPGSVLFRFIGHRFPGALIPENILESGMKDGWIEVGDPVPSATATKMAQQANGLLLIQPQSDTQVPGKLFEYVRYGRPILAYIRRNSPIDDVLSQCGIPNVCIYTEDDGNRVDEGLLRFLQISSGPWKPSPWFESTFNAVDQARTLCSLADQALEM